MDKAAFFASLRQRDSGIFGTSLSQRQVDGCEALLDALVGFPLDHAAHVLGECYHETGGGMYPVKETVFAWSTNKTPTDAQVIARLDSAFKAGKLKWVKTPYWRGGWFGRGFIQITHEDNYRKLSPVVGVDLVRNRDKALDPAVSARIAAEGCRLGLFTGKRLSDFDGPVYDHYNARAIVNGDKAANGGKVANYARSFAKALDAAGWRSAPVLPPDVEPADPAAPGGLLALLRALVGLFRR